MGDHIIERPFGDQAEIATARCWAMGLGLELAAFLMKIDLLAAECQRLSAAGKLDHCHSQHAGLKIAGCLDRSDSQHEMVER